MSFSLLLSVTRDVDAGCRADVRLAAMSFTHVCTILSLDRITVDVGRFEKVNANRLRLLTASLLGISEKKGGLRPLDLSYGFILCCRFRYGLHPPPTQ